MSNENKIVGGICLAFFIVIAYLFWMGPSLDQSTQIKNPDLLVKDNSHMTGKKGAKVTMVEFGDYQCPACATVNPDIKKIVETYKDNPDFNFVFRNFPLSQHKNAIPAAEAAESAGAQGKYFEMGTQLYENQREWSELDDAMPMFKKYAIAIGLEMVQFDSDMTQHKFASVIQADAVDGNGLFVDHTPTVYLNGLEIRDLNFPVIKAKIDELLAK
ncbi:MAG: thioredoxin domain-containing protein [bacterium]|nr:thioredoxin domain-containing protein [bacterium]